MFIIPLVLGSPADVLVVSYLKTTFGLIFYIYIQFMFNVYSIYILFISILLEYIVFIFHLYSI